jgi:hypothetical protein
VRGAAVYFQPDEKGAAVSLCAIKNASRGWRERVCKASAREGPAIRKDATAVIHDRLGPRHPWRGTLYSWPGPFSPQLQVSPVYFHLRRCHLHDTNGYGVFMRHDQVLFQTSRQDAVFTNPVNESG